MKIKEINIISYGKINNLKLNLNKNVNVIFGENESGKSTIRSFILNMFFAGTTSSLKRTIYTKEYENYVPWSNVQFEGSIVVEYLNNDYLIYRNFQKGNEDFKITNLENGEDSKKVFFIDESRKVQKFDNKFFSLSEDSFRDLFVFSDNHRMEENLNFDLKDKIVNHFSAKDENISVSKTIENIANYSFSKDDKKNLQRINNSILEKNRELEYLQREIDGGNHLDQIDNINKKISYLQVNLNKSNDKLKNFLNDEKKTLYRNKEYETLLEEKIKYETEIEKVESLIEKEDFPMYYFVIPLILIILFVFDFVSDLVGGVGLLLSLAFIFKMYLNNNNKTKKNKLAKENIKLLYSKLDGVLEKLSSDNFDINNNREIDFIEIESITEEINELKLDREKILQRIKLKDDNLRKILEIKEELKLLNLDKGKIEFKKSMGIKASEIVQDLSKIKFDNVSKLLIDDCSKFISSITNNKYTKLYVSEFGNITLYDNFLEKIVDIDSLSKGTVGQVYLAYRLGLILNSGIDFPIIIDDGFNLFDSYRNNESIKLLGDIGREYQIIYFTSNVREIEIFKNLNNVNIIYI